MNTERWLLLGLIVAVGFGGYVLGSRKGTDRQSGPEGENIAAPPIEKKRNAEGEWEAPLGQLAAELNLTRNQQFVLEEYVEQGREAMLEIFMTKREDGTSLMQELVDDLNAGVDPQEAEANFLAKVASENVPNTQQTYAEHAVDLRRRIRKAIDGLLEPDQQQKLEELRVDLLNTKTDFDPIADYIQRKTTTEKKVQ